MAGVTLGFLKYVLGLDTIAFRKGMTEAERDLVKLQKSFEAKGKQLQGLGKSLTAFVTLPIAGIAAAGIKEAQETQQAMAQVNAALASTGGAAGKTAAELQKAADAFELKSLHEADEILNQVSARLLAFGNITGQTFDRAQQAILDFSQRTGKDLGASTVIIGKALNDPVKAMGALSKAGVQLTADQQNLIKSFIDTGNVAGAQGVVLDALATKFGGAAQAAANTDPLNQANKAWKQMAETIGTALLPILPVFANAVSSVASAFASLPPGMQQAIIVVAGVSAAVGPLLIGLGGLIKLVAAAPAAVTALSAAWTALSTAFAAARIAALATLPALTPFLIPLGAIAVAVGAVYLAWKNWDKITAIVAAVYNAVKSYLVDKFNAVVNSVKQKVDAVIGFFKNMWDKVVGHSYVPDMVDGIAAEMERLDGVMVQPVSKATSKAAQAFQELQTRVKSLLDQLFPENARQIQFNKDLQDLTTYADKAKWSTEQLEAAVNRLRESYTGLPSNPAPSDNINPSSGPTTGTANDANIDYEKLGEWADSVGPKIDNVNRSSMSLAETLRAIGDISLHALNRFNDGLVDVILHSDSLKDAWKNLGDLVHKTAEQWLGDLIKLALKQAEMALFKAIFGLSFADGGLVKGFASGGFVSGSGGPRSDRVPAMLSNGEFVMTAAATKKFLPLLEQMNSGALKFAAGGFVNGRQIYSAPRLTNDNARRASNDRMPPMHFEFHNDYRGADPSSMAAIEARQDRFEREFPARVVATMRDAKDRFIWRG